MRIIFVCTGNTCRSPLAESYAKTKYRDSDVEFESRGLMVFSDVVSDLSAAIIEREDLDGPSVPKQLAAEDIEGALLLVMTESHRQAIEKRYPGARVELISTFSDGSRADIIDPYGGGPDDYEAVFRQLKGHIDRFSL